MAELNKAKDESLMPKTGDLSNKTKSYPAPGPVTAENFSQVPKKGMADAKTEGKAAHHTKAKLNKGGAARISD